MAADCSPWCLNFLLSLCGCMRSLPSLLAHSAALVEFHGVLFLVPWSSYVISHPCLLFNCPLSSDAHLRSRWQKRLRSQPWVAVHDVGNSQQHLPHQKWYRPCDVNERGVLVLPSVVLGHSVLDLCRAVSLLSWSSHMRIARRPLLLGLECRKPLRDGCHE